VGLAKSGTKEVLTERLRQYLNEDLQNAVELPEYLNKIDGWENQHVYLYLSPAGISKKWRSADYVREVLSKNGARRSP